MPHQVCEFHVKKEITKAVLHALATIRKELRAQIPKQPRGRPRKAEQAQARKVARQQKQVSALFEHRHLFVQHRLTPAQEKTLQRITRGFAHLRSLRSIMEEVYRLFDRRCRTETALARLARLRQHVRRFKWLNRALNQLSSPNLEKALTFLDDKLLPATSNAVERSNRRIAKRNGASTRCGRQSTFASGSRWTCSGNSRHPTAARPRRLCIRLVLGRKNSNNDATVSTNVVFLREPRGSAKRRLPLFFRRVRPIGCHGGPWILMESGQAHHAGFGAGMVRTPRRRCRCRYLRNTRAKVSAPIEATLTASIFHQSEQC